MVRRGQVWIGWVVEESLETSMGAGSQGSLEGLGQQIASLLSCGGCVMAYNYAAAEILTL